MALVISYETLFELLRKEQSREDLQVLPETFFADILDFMLKKNGANTAPGATSHRAEIEFRNIKKVLKELYERRERKILSLALNKARTESAIIDQSVLLPEERELFDTLVGAFRDNKRDVLDRVLALKAPSVKTPPRKEPEETTGTEYMDDTRETANQELEDDEPVLEEMPSGPVRLRFLKNVPKILGHDKTVLGPFVAGAETELDKKIAGILLKKGFAEEI